MDGYVGIEICTSIGAFSGEFFTGFWVKMDGPIWPGKGANPWWKWCRNRTYNAVKQH